jgi:hypothetical protein
MAKSLHEQWHVKQPDFIPEHEEHLYPHRGGVFCDFIPEKSSADEVRPTEPVNEVSLEPVPPQSEMGDAATIEPTEKPRKK